MNQIDYYTGFEVQSTGLDSEIDCFNDFKVGKDIKEVNVYFETLVFTGLKLDKNKKGELDLYKSIEIIKRHLIHRSPEKYKSFFETIQSDMKYGYEILGLNEVGKRFELFELIYFAMRLLDDIVDGDTLEKIEIEDRKNIVENIYNQISGKKGLFDLFMTEIERVSKELGIFEKINYSILQIIGSLKFDILRIIDENKIRTGEELDKNFNSMDIEGTIYAQSIIMGIIPKSGINILETLGIAHRKSLTLFDLPDDIRSGLINISQEDLVKYNISQEDLNFMKNLKEKTLLKVKENNIELPEGIKNWINDEIQITKKLFKKHKKDNPAELFEENKLKNLKNLRYLFSILNLKWDENSLENKNNIYRTFINNIIIKGGVLPRMFYRDIEQIIELKF